MNSTLVRDVPFRLAPPEQRSFWVRYGVAVACVFACTLLSLLMAKFAHGAAFLFFFPAPLVSLLIGGERPAWFAAVLSALAVDFFLLPPYFQLTYLWADAFFFLIFGLTAWLFERRRKWAAMEIDRQRELLNLSFDPICVRDRSDRITFWNKGAERLYGWTAKEAIGRDFTELLRTEFPTSAQQIKSDFLQQGHWFGELVHTRKDGTKVVVASQWTLKRDVRGNVDSSLIVNHDLTKERKLQASLRASEERLAAIIRSAMDAIITLDRELRVIMFNSAAEEIFGHTAEQAVGQPIEKFIPERMQGQQGESIRQWIESHELTRSDRSVLAMTGLRSNGEEFPVEATISHNLIGGEQLFTVILRDITTRKQTEAALIRSEKLASLGQLSASIAHEMNNPLGALGNLLYLLKTQSSLDNAARGYVEDAQREFGRVVEISRRTLGFARSGGSVTKLNLRETIQNVLSLLGPTIRQKNVSFDTEFVNTPDIYAVETEVRQILWNLLNNALEAVPNGGRIRARVSAAHTQTGRPGVRIAIADNGPGIKARDLPRLYEPFFTTKETGTGLGLWVLGEILKKYGACFRVRSRTEPGRSGTVFSFVLPVHASGKEELPKAG